MKDKRSKFKFSMGLAFAEEKEMKMLTNMAAKGWIFHEYKGLGYKFKKGESQDLIYNFDSVKISEEDKDEYLEFFEKAGWKHVCSVGDSIHFFSAKLGTAPIYSDKHTVRERNNRGIKDIFKGVGYLVLLCCLLLLIQQLLKGIFKNQIVDIIISMGIGGSIGLIVMFIICVIFMKFKKRKI